MFKGYIFLQFYWCLCILYGGGKSISEATQLEGKLACNVKWAMQVASE